MAKLKVKGLSALYNNIIDNIWAAAAHVEGHITAQMEKNMATLSESITRFGTAVHNEFEQIKAQAEANLAATKEALEAAGSENTELKEALDEQVSLNEDLIGQIDEATSRLDSLSTELESNDETTTEPEPGEPPYVDNTLPNELPVEGEPPVVDPRQGNRRGQRK